MNFNITDWLNMAYSDICDDEYIGCLYEKASDESKSSIMLNEDTLFDFDAERVNVYFTLNYFNSKKSRKTSNLSKHRAFYLDIDPYHKDIKLEDALAAVKNEIGKSIPYPSAIIRSGQGFYVIWFIDPIGPEYADIWSNMQRMLHDILAPYGSDPQSLDAPRVLRVPGSINAKPGVNKVVEIDEINPDAVYTIDSFAGWFGKKPEDFVTAQKPFTKGASQKKKTQGKRKKNKHKMRDASNKLSANQQLARLRAQDIATVLINRTTNLIGCREVGLFLYRHFLMQSGVSQDEALAMTLDLNSHLHAPLSESEAKNATRTSKDKRYHYKNITIINKLKITIEEQKLLTTLVMYKDDKSRRWAKTGRTISRADETQAKKNKIAELQAQGKSINQICDIMGCSRTTYYNLTRGCKKYVTKKNTIYISPRVLPILIAILQEKSSLESNCKSVNLLPYIIKNKKGKAKSKECESVNLYTSSIENNKKYAHIRAGPAP